MNPALIVVVWLAIPLLWITSLTDRRSFNGAIKLREMITEILLSLAEWQNGKSTVFKILTLKSYPENLVNRLRLIRGYMIVRLVVKLPRKRSVQAASDVLQQFYECVWGSAPGFPPSGTHGARDQKIADMKKRFLRGQLSLTTFLKLSPWDSAGAVAPFSGKMSGRFYIRYAERIVHHPSKLNNL